MKGSSLDFGLTKIFFVEVKQEKSEQKFFFLEAKKGGFTLVSHGSKNLRQN
jgi:hypothetical protein